MKHYHNAYEKLLYILLGVYFSHQTLLRTTITALSYNTLHARGGLRKRL